MSNITCVWQPKYKTREVLVSDLCIADGNSYVFFSADRNWTHLYKYDGHKVLTQCQKQKNGKGYVYCIPLSWLEDMGELPEQFNPEKEKSYQAYKKYQEKQKAKK